MPEFETSAMMQQGSSYANPVSGAAHGRRWQFWIDRGGTFTDIVACRPDGNLITHKLLSENPEHYADAAVAGIRHLLGLSEMQAITPEQVECVRMGTTVATNALLERKGEPTLLVMTQGFGDALRIAWQNRPRLFDLQIVLPELLYAQVLEVEERMGADGAIVQPLNLMQARQGMQAAYAAGLRAVAIVLMHSWQAPAHEQALAEVAREIGFAQISVSHQVSPWMKLVARGDTTVVDAYLSPVLQRYMAQLARAMPGVRLQCMQSNGGLTEASRFAGKDAILSGPAGGIVGMARVSEAAGFTRAIGFDMGGTSTDVAHYAGAYERVFETQVAGVRVRAPMMHIHTVAAGGGSILRFDGQRLRVGPESAGANPGPACYRRGGPLTVTDANLLLGRIQADWFPQVFGPQGHAPLDPVVVQQGFMALAESIQCSTGREMRPEQLAEGFIEIAIANMANAIKQISVQRGYDVSAYVLTTFGGAGGQHACQVADALGMRQVLAHPLGGVLSAYGMGLAETRVMREQAVEMTLTPQAMPVLQAVEATLQHAARAELQAQQGQGTEAQTDTSMPLQQLSSAHLRYAGTDTALQVPLADAECMRLAFEQAYRQRYAFTIPGKALIVEALSVELITPGAAMAELTPPKRDRREALQPACLTRLYAAGDWHDAGLYPRDALCAGDQITGPALIAEQNATLFIAVGWQAELHAQGHLLLTRIEHQNHRKAVDTHADPVLLEVFNNLFMSIAEQMGLRLQNTAHSVNIKERLDFSCAIFDAMGNLIANAPHMPVHLGSMGESIQTVIQRNAGQIVPGDVYALNDPYHGGTHLPDVTVITPVFDEVGRHILFYVGSRGHHADIGGISPGSMPPDSTSVEEEGVLFDNWKLVAAGQLRETETLTHLMDGHWPARNPAQNLADLRAQVAANQKGVEELQKMVAHWGLSVVQAYMGHVQDNAEEAVRRVIPTLRDGRYQLQLDNGAQIAVAIRIDPLKRTADIDFTGTSAQLPNNFNAPKAVCMAAVLYVFRTLVAEEIPLNAGCLKPLRLQIPEGSMLNPRYPASVVSGNVETSSCIVNALYGALGIVAASQGTMNNFTFGNTTYQYYETLAGGSGAGQGFHGTDVVQTAMTNSRLTDPEVLEWRFPVRLERYAIRQGSGGAGRWHGGNGAIRDIRFLQAMRASILSNNRVYPPFGAAGGQAGALGRNRVIRANGTEEVLSHIASVDMLPGDRFVIETPGGGGYGCLEAQAGDC